MLQCSKLQVVKFVPWFYSVGPMHISFGDVLDEMVFLVTIIHRKISVLDFLQFALRIRNLLAVSG